MFAFVNQLPQRFFVQRNTALRYLKAVFPQFYNAFLLIAKLSDQMPIEINKTHQETNIFNSNIFEYLENAKRQDSATSKDVFQQTSNVQLPTSYAKNFSPQEDRPDNTSSSLTTEKDNVLEGKRERKEACQIQKTHHHHLSDIQKLTCRTRKITM